MPRGSYAQKGYFMGFYFTLDALATMTIFIDFLPLFMPVATDDDSEEGA